MPHHPLTATHLESIANSGRLLGGIQNVGIVARKVRSLTEKHVVRLGKRFPASSMFLAYILPARAVRTEGKEPWQQRT